jgi:hypothetical protein
MEWYVNCGYRDKGGWRHEDDQFLKYLHNGTKTIPNSGGIRFQNFININPIEDNTKQRIPPYIVLLTAEISTSWNNPWSDIVSYASGEIIYWGDAKITSPRKSWNDFTGNKVIWAINHLRQDGDKELIPPILHFTKPKQGEVKFTGLCMLRNCELAWFGEEGAPVVNLKIALDILDIDRVNTSWLTKRSSSNSKNKLLVDSPKVWRDAVNGKVRRLNIWRSGVRSKVEQLPMKGTSDYSILEQLRAFNGFQFERISVAIVDLIPELVPGIIHHVDQTKLTGDGGVDMLGFFRLPEPIEYMIRFKGEAKNWSSAVRPKDVSRLVARLQRGEHGLFFTTSYYSKQAQEEVLSDGYPVRLFSGLDIVNFLKRTNRISNGKIDPEWIKSILD